jgi:hypothetical protein
LQGSSGFVARDEVEHRLARFGCDLGDEVDVTRVQGTDRE